MSINPSLLSNAFVLHRAKIFVERMVYFFVKSQVSKLVEERAKNSAERAGNTRKFDSRLQHENTINRSGETIHVELLLDTNDCLSRSFVLLKTKRSQTSILWRLSYPISIRYILIFFYMIILYSCFFFVTLFSRREKNYYENLRNFPLRRSQLSSL